MKTRTTAMLIALSFISSALCGCSLTELLPVEKEASSLSSSVSESGDTYVESDETYTYISLDSIKLQTEALIEHTETSGNENVLKEDIQRLLDDLDSISEALSYITADYYSDFDNAELEERYDSCYEDYFIAYELLTYAFSNGYACEEYSTLFEPYIDEEYYEGYADRSMSIKRLEGYARVDFEIMDESLDEYYDIFYSEDMSDEEKNLAAAEIYLDILSVYDAETFYEGYNRDFTPERAIALSDTVKDTLLPASEKLAKTFNATSCANDVYDDPVLFENPFETLREYAPKLSPSIGKYADKLCDEKLYFITEGNGSYDGAFTSDLPVSNSAVIYSYLYNDAYDMLTAIHEFGHFYASFYDETPTYLQCNNIDIAEVQSQGMEMLYMRFYDELYGEQAEAMRLYKIYDTVWAVISGFCIGEFEYSVLCDIDTITPEEIVERFDKLMKEYDYDVELYYMTHIFEQPGYYISYGVSALAALDIWNTSLTDEAAATEMYERIASVPCNSEEYTFMSALKSSGFENVLDERYIKSIAQSVEEYAE